MTLAENKMKTNNKNTKLFMLDNLDSFTYNLVDEFQCLGFEPTVYRNTLSSDFIFNKMLEHTKKTGEKVILVLSPGPGEPKKAGCLMALIKLCAGKIPMIGICLGHQALIEHYGGTVGRAEEIVHGKSSPITHCASGAFANIPNPLPVARYHSLVGIKVPDSLTVIADYNNMPMAICQEKDAILAYQFHPESILTTFGSTLLAQSFDYLLTLSENLSTKARGV
ncbi:aminodeoxychorismate/anthranilate synthase component II [Colwellia sp. 1_MG-2023]|jgi:anthranilate synthase component 2|uniref:aminodeoxychorismate/anthranilate synthase component II n=1 Tax=unclassified Colwellia TaxID=196834 RepID=UPI002091C889|nr:MULTISPECIES: aminodeoxychorismate/anthranilate synthase component II [unclassified Colwellia]MDO6653639.1 aminodeoxychorismate/anthranilate synthase component II [Colwellia sp. 3_MG-2023]MDO6666572.1 aminodeoxychorismate/anthranilate synthase component II [Colwellia sp. 2_MG-2023]MDO6691015.1 aminodeoxychorismate/anthranilate synthase component II [Colwellia sp. 1_MG-2023]